MKLLEGVAFLDERASLHTRLKHPHQYAIDADDAYINSVK
jgi:hypothetical protein